MFWQYPNGGAALAQTVRSLSWPVSGNPPPTTTTKGTTSTPTPTGGQGCGGVSAWVSNIAYTGGQKVSYNGRLWTAKWWTQAEVPGGSSGVWTDSGSC
jgi:chitinase